MSMRDEFRAEIDVSHSQQTFDIGDQDLLVDLEASNEFYSDFIMPDGLPFSEQPTWITPVVRGLPSSEQPAFITPVVRIIQRVIKGSTGSSGSQDYISLVNDLV